MQSGLVSNFVFTILDKNRKVFKELSFHQIINKIETSQTYYNDFKNFVNSSDSFIDLEANKNFVKRYLSAEFCRQLLGENQFYQVVLKDDVMIKEALKL